MTEKQVLNMTIRKAFAQQILRGEKKREYRAFSDHWASRLCTFDDPKDKFLATGIRHYDILHLYPYNAKWYLDVEVKDILMGEVDQEFLDNYGNEVEAEIGSNIFVIFLGDVIDTNLTAE